MLTIKATFSWAAACGRVSCLSWAGFGLPGEVTLSTGLSHVPLGKEGLYGPCVFCWVLKLHCLQSPS